jgi:hypothetical protein
MEAGGKARLRLPVWSNSTLVRCNKQCEHVFTWQSLKEKKGSATRNREEMAKVLVVVTSHSDLGDTGKKTGKI